MITKNCKICGVELHRSSREAKSRFNTRQFCKRSCADISRKGEGNPHWKGGRARHIQGYSLVYKPEHPRCQSHGYILEHRYMMEEELGRPLAKGEIVHHINGIKDDNRIENLELVESQSEHIRIYHPDINNVTMSQNGM